MRKIGIVFLAIVLAAAASSQDAVPVHPIDPLKKAQSQRTGGWILSGLGACGLIGTLVADAGQAVGGAFITILSGGTEQPERKSFAVPYFVSATALVGGIALLAASSRTKHRAKDVSHFFTVERTEVVQRGGVRRQALPVAGIRVAL